MNRVFPPNRFNHRKDFAVETNDEVVIQRITKILREANPDGIVSLNEAITQRSLPMIGSFAKEPAPLIC